MVAQFIKRLALAVVAGHAVLGVSFHIYGKQRRRDAEISQWKTEEKKLIAWTKEVS